MPSDNAPAVHCQGVTKSYGTGNATVMAWRGVDLDVRSGELLMLVGPSGCGKTTLISVMAGILDQDEGACLVLHQHFKQMAQPDKTRYRGQTIGFVFQAFNLIPALTIAENVAVPLLINGVRRRLPPLGILAALAPCLGRPLFPLARLLVLPRAT